MSFLTNKETEIAAFITGVILVAVIVAFSINKDQGMSADLAADSYQQASVRNSFGATAELVSAPQARQTLAKTSSLTSVPEPSDNRKVQQIFDFGYIADRDNISTYYQSAGALCVLPDCEMAHANLNTQGNRKIGQLTLSVSHGNFDGLMEAIDSLGTDLRIAEQSQTSIDKTRQFEDVTARLNSKIELRSRLERLVSNYAGDQIRSLLEIERELARVQGEIESMDAQIRSINQTTDRITVNLSFTSEALSVSPEYPPYVANALKEVLRVSSHSTAQIITLVAKWLPWGVVGLLIALGYWVSRITYRWIGRRH